MHIYASFRHPHHLIPSTWPILEYVLGVLFASVATISLLEFWRSGGKKSGMRQHTATTLAILVVLVFCTLAFIAGYILVKVFPLRLAVIAQPFRLVTVVTWLGSILIAHSIFNSLQTKGWNWSVLFMASTVSVPTLVLYRALSVSGGSCRNSPGFLAASRYSRASHC